jgi:hypothetical protein
VKKKIRNNKNSISKIILLRIVAVLVLLGVVAGVVVIIRNVFTVKNIECQLLTTESCPQELLESLSSVRGSSMFFEDYTQKLTDSQTTSQPVSLVIFKKKLPDTLTVTFQQEPTAYTILHSEQPVIVSKTGRIFTQEMDTSGLLPVEIAGEFTTAEGFIDFTIHQTILSIIETCNQLSIPITLITWVDKSTIKLSMENRTELFIIDSEKPTLEINRLALILKSGEYRNIPESKQELDLRFTMPVLRIQP